MNGVLFRNIYSRSKYLTNSTKSWKCTYTQGIGRHIRRLWKKDENSSRWLSNLVPKSKILITYRWISVGTVASGRNTQDIDKSDEDEFSEQIDTMLLESDNGNIPVPSNKVRKEDHNEEIPVGKEVIDTLQDLFDMNHLEALKTARSPKLFHIADAIIMETLLMLDDFGIPAKQIQYSPWILLQSADEVKKKLNILTKPFLFDNILDGFGFCYFRRHKIEEYQQKFHFESNSFPNHKNRIYYMADQLTVPVDLLTAKIVKVQPFLSMSINRIKDYMQLFNKYGVHRKDIVNDLWIFRHNSDASERRLKAITEAGCKRPKLWMCRCLDETFERTLYKYQSKKDTLGDCRSLEEYLMKRLQCTQEDLMSSLDIDSVLTDVSVIKAKRVLDLLFLEGYTSEQIRQSLRLLRYNEERTAMRIKRLKDLKIMSYPTTVLYKSQRLFEVYIENIKNMKKG